MKRWGLLWGLAASLLAPTAAADDGDDFHLTVEGGTHLPMDVGGQISVEFPYRLRLVGSLGVLPGAYLDIINGVVVGAGGYDQATADLIAAALDNSLVFRGSVGWRPLPAWGWTVDVGYGLATLGGEVAGADLLGLVLGTEIDTEGTADNAFDVASTLHLVTIDTGYEWVFWDALVVGARLGFAGTVASSTEVVPPTSPRPAVNQALIGVAREGEAYLDDIYTSYVFTPVVSLTAGYRFF